MMLSRLWRKIKALFHKEEVYTFTPKDPEAWLVYIKTLQEGRSPTKDIEIENALNWLERTGSSREEAMSALAQMVQGIINMR